MSNWNLVLAGCRAWAAVRNLRRRWRRAVGVRSCRRVTANGRGRSGKIAALNSAASSPANSAVDGAKFRGRATRPNVSKPMIPNDFSAIDGNFSGPKEIFPLPAAENRRRALRRHTEKYLAWGWWRTMAEVDCSGSSWSSSERVMPISSARSNARSCCWSARLGQAG